MPTATTIATRLAYLALEGSYIPREYYVFDDRRLVYMPIYKVASTSIKTALIRPEQAIRSYPQQMDVHAEGSFGHHFLFGYRRRRYFKFAFVRNPFERLVSCYEDRVRREIYEPIGRQYFDTSYNSILIKRLFGSTFSTKMSFADFVRLVARIPDVISDGHFKSQYGWTHRFGRRIPDYVGKLENLDQDWEPIARRFGLPFLERTNSSDRHELADYFASPDIVELAARRYLRDIREFGYEDDYLALQRVTLSKRRRSSP